MFEIISIAIKFLLQIFESISWLLNSTEQICWSRCEILKSCFFIYENNRNHWKNNLTWPISFYSILLMPTMCQELWPLQRFCAVDHQESSGLTPVKDVSKQCGGRQDPECVRGVRPSYRRSNLWQVDLICLLREQKLQYKQWPLSQPGIATAMGNE